MRRASSNWGAEKVEQLLSISEGSASKLRTVWDAWQSKDSEFWKVKIGIAKKAIARAGSEVTWDGVYQTRDDEDLYRTLDEVIPPLEASIRQAARDFEFAEAKVRSSGGFHRTVDTLRDIEDKFWNKG